MEGTNMSDTELDVLDLDALEEEEQKQLFKCLDNPRVRTNDDGTRTVTLADPVKTKRGEIKEVTYQIPKGRDWMATDSQKGDFSKAVALAASVANLPIVVFEAMSEADFLLCVQVVGTMGKKSPTGQTF